MKEILKKDAPVYAWLLALVVTSLAIFAWGNNYNWNFANLSSYMVFPLLGLIAFSLMWTHYVMYGLRIYSGFDKELLRSYQYITGVVVLIFILLHPGLLILQLYIDGNGLPPESYTSYVDESALGFVMFGTIAWLAFMAYELKEKFSGRAWWRYVSLANAAAMILILIHAYNLGGTVAQGWYSGVWTIYGLSLIAVYIYLFAKKKLV